jgi:pSer/pThr/pTyr-binding forkhead associated (FHA) protein
MMKRLVLKAISGPISGKEISLEAGQVIRVGRTSKSDLVTGDSYMSGEHFALECTDKICRVRDLNSRNGTFLNKERITEALLQEGDKISGGQTTLIVHIEKASPAVELPQSIKIDKKTLHELAAPASQTPTKKPVASPHPTKEILETPAPALPLKEKPPNSTNPIADVSPTSAPQKIPVTPSQQQQPSALAPTLTPLAQKIPATSIKSAPLTPLELAAAATPEGRLLNILRETQEPLFAILDAAREPKVPEILRGSGAEYQSLYVDDAFAESAPYLVYLPPSSTLLEKLVHEGWGRGWLVYLSCQLPIRDIREYFRQTLMIKMPDGREFFSRFYDPRFFRVFLRGCTRAEAERFFGPIKTYLMEAENSEILLEFKRSGNGVEMKERLLLISGT